MAIRPHIFLVDDDEAVTSSLSRLFRDEFVVRCYTQGPAAIADLIDLNPAIVIVDYRLPGMTGLDLLRQVEQKLPTSVRTLLTGHVELQSISEAINGGLLHRFFLKPWDNEVLLSQMKECIGLHQLLLKNTELARLSSTDAVTGAYNHRYFQETLKIETERAKRHNRDLSLLMIDLDHFKSLNDKYGHIEGDHALQWITKTMQISLRTFDIVCRYGGDEFAVILPDTKLSDAHLVAERLRNATQKRDAKLPPISLSLGVACFPLHGQNPRQLIEAADLALLSAKRGGRNRTEIAT